MKKYKVLSLLKDFSGKFEPEKFEQALNGYAEQGWNIIACVSGDFYYGTSKNEFIAILEKHE